MKYIVTRTNGQPVRMECLAIEVDVEDATWFKSREEAEKEARRMTNLPKFLVKPLIPLDQQ